MALYTNGDLDGMSNYINSMTFVPEYEGGVSVTLTEDKMGVIVSDGARSVLVDLETGRQTVIDARDENGDDNGNGDKVIVPGVTNFSHGDIDFSIAGGLTQGQVNAIKAMVNGMDIDGFSDFVESITFGQDVENGLVIDVGTGENAMANIYIEHDAGAAALAAALADAQLKVEEERDLEAPEPEAIHVITRDYLPFYIHGHATQEEQDALKAAVLALPEGHASMLRPYIHSWTQEPAGSLGDIAFTFEMEDVPWAPHGRRANVISAEDVNNLQNITYSAMMEIREYMGLGGNQNGNGDDPTYLELTGSGDNTIRFEQDGGYADGFAALRAEAQTLTQEQINRYAEHIDVVVQLRAGAWGDEGRWIAEESGKGWFLYRDGTAGTLAEDLAWARAEITDENGLDPFHVFTDAAGNELSFFAEEGFDYAAALAWVTAPGNQAFLGAISPFVASLTFQLDVDGNRQIRLGEDGRAVVLSDGSDTIRDDLEWGQAVGMGLFPPTHTMLNLIKAQISNVR